MIGSFLIRGLMMVFGYAYPAYECYKTVEKSKPEIEQLRFWCQYWILVAFLTVCERVGDTFISWVPMYSEAKLAFLIYLWYPKTKGTTYVYNSFFRPYVAKHENEIDRNLLELRTRAGDLATLCWSYLQTRVFEILQYVAAQSTSVPHPSQQQRQGARTRPPPNGLNRQPSTSTPGRQPAMTQTKTEEPPSPMSCTSSSQCQMEVAGNVGPSQVPEAALPTPTASLNALKVNDRSETSIQTAPTKAEATQIEAMPSSSVNENTSAPTKETIMEETIQFRRGSSRENHSGANG